MKKQLSLAIVGLTFCSSLFAMASSNTGQPSMENYKRKLTNADQELVRVIAERKAIRKQMFKFEKKHKLATYDPFNDEKLKKPYGSFAVQYDVSPQLVDKIFGILNTSDLQTAEQSF